MLGAVAALLRPVCAHGVPTDHDGSPRAYLRGGVTSGDPTGTDAVDDAVAVAFRAVLTDDQSPLTAHIRVARAAWLAARAADGASRRSVDVASVAVHLARRHGLTIAEIADVLGAPPDEIGHHVTRPTADARRPLRAAHPPYARTAVPRDWCIHRPAGTPPPLSRGSPMTLRELQTPIKDRYRTEPNAARITLRATGSAGDSVMACNVDLGRALYAAGAHAGVGGDGSAACSGDLLLGALAACAQLTCQMVAANMGLDVTVTVTVEGDLDLRGTLGTPDVPVGFEAIRITFGVDGEIAPDRLEKLVERTEKYCVVFQTLLTPPPVQASWAAFT